MSDQPSIKYSNILDWPFRSYPDGAAIIQIDESEAKYYSGYSETLFVPNKEPFVKVVSDYFFGDMWTQSADITFTTESIFDTQREAENNLIKRVFEHDDFEEE